MNTAMRTPKDRLRHTILFELLLLAICVPLLSFILGQSLEKIGVMSAMLCVVGATWNYIYNYLFDHGLVRLNMPLYPRSKSLRIVHSVLFELSLLAVTIPAVMLHLNYTFWQALMVDIGFAAFVPVYAFFYNVMYDRVFPPPMAEPA